MASTTSNEEEKPSRAELLYAYLAEHGPSRFSKACVACGIKQGGWSSYALAMLAKHNIAVTSTRPRMASIIGQEVKQEYSYAQRMLDCFEPGQTLTTDQLASIMGLRNSTFYINLSLLAKQGNLARTSHGVYKRVR